jgi:hypothetical protein
MAKVENWWVTPKRRLKDLPKDITIESKIDIFYERINGWKLDIADELINGRRTKQEGTTVASGNLHAGYAVLDITLSYFEMIAKYYYGYVDKSSERYFKKGVRMVFPESKNDKPELVEQLLDTLYSGARCGMYHVGLTDTQIFLTGEGNAALVFRSDGKIVINPHILVRVLKSHFNDYIKQLRDPKNSRLRRNFEKRFDQDVS